MRATTLLVAAALSLVACKRNPPPPVPSLKASQLLAEYRRNEVDADSRYKGKRLRVAGFAAKIERSVFGDIVVQFKEGETRAEVVEADKAKVAKLSPGQAVLLECTGRGFVLGAPMLGECSVVTAGKPKG